MGKPNTSLTVALCVSLIAHGLGLSGLAWWYVQHNLFPKTAPIDRAQVLVDRMNEQEKQKTPPPAATPPPAQKPKKQAPPPPMKMEKPSDRRKDDSGEANGTGTANRSTDGDKPMQAESGYEQADLMKPADHFADTFLPASAGKEQGSNNEQQKSPKAGSYVPTFTPDATALSTPMPKPTAVATPVKGPGPAPKPDDQQAVASAVSGTKDPIPNVPAAQAPTPKPAEKEIRGHRATVSDTESVALAKVNSGVFRAGKLVGRKGLKVVTTIPRFGLASEVDIEALGGIRTIVEARVDADGKVQDVEVVQTSGSSNVDQDCKTAVWDWTLEPEKDKAGHPVDYTWTIAFE